MRIRSKLRSVVRRFRPPKPRPLILMYHRIADEPIDNWGLAVSPRCFEEQLQVLGRTRHPLSLSDFVRRLVTGTLPSNAVAITFDDGYADNLLAGKPRLAAAGVPATVFLATGYLNRPGQFWWDELSGLVLAGEGPRNLQLKIRGETLKIDLGADGDAASASAQKRQTALTRLWQSMRLIEDDERDSFLTELRSILAVHRRDTGQGRPMTGEEVRTLVKDNLVTIGAHTVSHPVLSKLDATTCHREILDSKLACEALIGAAVDAFAYPYGDFDAKARGTTMAAGFGFACSTRHAQVDPTSDVFSLPRMQVRNWRGDEFERALHF